MCGSFPVLNVLYVFVGAILFECRLSSMGMNAEFHIGTRLGNENLVLVALRDRALSMEQTQQVPDGCGGGS